MVLYLVGVGGIFTSIASHTIWLGLTYVSRHCLSTLVENSHLCPSYSWIFWLATAASLTSMLGGGYVCSHTDLTYCNQNVAAEAFAWIEW